MDEAFGERDLRARVGDGGCVLGAFIVARSEDAFVVYIRGTWLRGRGFRIVRTWRDASDRTFRNLQSAWCFIRKFDFAGHVTVYPAGDPDLRQFVGISSRDMAEFSSPGPVLPNSTVAARGKEAGRNLKPD